MPTILQNHHVLAVPDKEVTARFFIDMMGFSEEYREGGWVFVRKDECLIMLGQCPGAIRPRDLGDHSYFSYLIVDDADAYWQELRTKKAEFVDEISDKPWGLREFGVRTPDGFRLMIGHRLRT